MTLLLFAAFGLFLAACSGGGTPPAKDSGSTGGGTPPPTTPPSTPPTYTLSLSIDKLSILANNTDSATATATLLDNLNVPLKDATITFATTGGQINASSVTTDTNGVAAIIVKSGPIKTNQTINISASATYAQAQTTQISITGTTLTLSTDKTNIETGTTSTLTATLKDVANIAISSTTVNFVITSGSGFITLSADNGATDTSGQISITISAINAGTAVVQAAALGAVASQTYIIAAPATAFGITTPSEDPKSLSTNTALPIITTAPGVTTVEYFTSIGFWNNGENNYEAPVAVNGTATANLTSTTAGTTNVIVRDKANPTTKTDSIQINISAPPAESASLALQASSTVVAPSTGPSKNTVTLEAFVRSANGAVVGNAPVQFSIINSTGGGENILPIIVNTNDFGKAATTFYSGTSSDSDGITVRAKVNGITYLGNPIQDDINIIIGGTPGSVTLGCATEITVVNTTTYSYPFTVQVDDANGNPVKNATVTLNIWPTHYRIGYWNKLVQVIQPPPSWLNPVNDYDIPNEDVNKNLRLDNAEDIGPIGSGDRCPIPVDATPDGKLTPPNSSAGSVPPTVNTLDDGTATFNLTYLKSYSGWIKIHLTASVLVYGTETSSSYDMWLTKEESETHLGASPFGYFSDSPPSANAGTDQSVVTGTTVQLTNLSSDPDYDTLDYDWTILGQPAGSTATLSDTTAYSPSFTADVAGSYVIQLITSDCIYSVADTVTITATAP